MRITTSPWMKLWQGLAVSQVPLLVTQQPGSGARELPRFQQDLAFAADALAAAGSIDVDPGQSKRPAQVFPVRAPPP